MKITYPRMGNLSIGLRALFKRLGLEVVEPPPISKRTMTLGSQHSPEFVCLPFKVNLGNFIEALEKGADAIVVAGGRGPCRFGYYGQSQAEILKELGYKFKVITVEAADGSADEFTAGIAELAGGKSKWEIASAIYFGYRKLCACDLAEQLTHRIRAREAEKGAAARVYAECLDLVDRARTVQEVRRAEGQIRRRFGAIPIDETRPVLKVGVVGEIYDLIEPFTNLHIEDRLNDMGVQTYRAVYIGHWIKHHLFVGALGLSPSRLYRREAAPYLDTEVGGHAMETVGRTVQFARQGFDGVIQVAPFGCMPEIVAKTLLTEVTEDHNIPVLSLFLDEHAGEAGFQTRLEAFIDLISRRKRVKKSEGISGS